MALNNSLHLPQINKRYNSQSMPNLIIKTKSNHSNKSEGEGMEAGNHVNNIEVDELERK